MSDLRVLTIDIETSPNLAYVWGLWDQNVGLSQIAETGNVICFAAKWHGKKHIEYRSDHHDGHDTMVKRAHELIDEADGIVTYNGRSFDMKHLRREFVLAGYGPPSPHTDIDLLTVARRQFKFASNKLEHVASQLGIGSKVKHSGFELWRDCMAGDPKAWDDMRQYNIQDVRLTEQLYDRLLPWIHNHPHHGLHNGLSGGNVCQNCGSDRLQWRGYAHTPLTTYRQYQCKACTKYGRSRQRVHTVDARGVG